MEALGQRDFCNIVCLPPLVSSSHAGGMHMLPAEAVYLFNGMFWLTPACP